MIQNLGLIDLSLGDPASAIRWFKKADTTDANTVFLYNRIAKAFLEMKKQDSATRYLELARKENLKWNGQTKNVANGLTFFTRLNWRYPRISYQKPSAFFKNR